MTVVGDFSVRGGIKTVVTASTRSLNGSAEHDARGPPSLGGKLVLSVDPVHIPIEPELDLHAFAPRDIAAVVDDYVDAAAEAGLREVRLVHGRGRGVQRGIVQAALERHPLRRRILGRSGGAPGRDDRQALGTAVEHVQRRLRVTPHRIAGGSR